MAKAYFLCYISFLLGVGFMIGGLTLGIKALIKLEKPVDKFLMGISQKLLVAGGVITSIAASISLFLKEV